jgi:hypothetical protein
MPRIHPQVYSRIRHTLTAELLPNGSYLMNRWAKFSVPLMHTPVCQWGSKWIGEGTLWRDHSTIWLRLPNATMIPFQHLIFVRVRNLFETWTVRLKSQTSLARDQSTDISAEHSNFLMCWQQQKIIRALIVGCCLCLQAVATSTCSHLIPEVDQPRRFFERTAASYVQTRWSLPTANVIETWAWSFRICTLFDEFVLWKGCEKHSNRKKCNFIRALTTGPDLRFWG